MDAEEACPYVTLGQGLEPHDTHQTEVTNYERRAAGLHEDFESGGGDAFSQSETTTTCELT